MTTFTYEHKVHKALAAGRLLRGWTQAQMAELMADATGNDGWNADRITAIENDRRKVTDVELRTFAEIQGFDVEFYWYGPPVNRRVLRDLSSAIPGLRDSTDGTRHLCWECVENPDAHVLPEWLTPYGQIPGQVDLFVEAA